MRLCKPEYRNLLAFVLRYDESARAMFRHLRKLGARNIRPDYILFKTPNGTYDRATDPGMWYADCNGGLFVAMVRHGESDWSLHS